MNIRLLLTSTALVSGLASASLGDDVKIDAKAQEIVQRVFDYYKSIKGASFTSEVTMSSQAMPTPLTQASSVNVAKPNMFSSRDDSGMGGANLFSDGKTISISVPEFQLYEQSTAPASLTTLFTEEGGVGEIFMMADPSVSIALSLFTDEPSKTFFEGVADEVSSAESKDFNGIQTDGISFTKNDEMMGELKMTAYFAQGDTPHLVALVPDVSAMMPPDMPPMEVTIMTKDWKATVPEASAFAFKPEEGWEKVDDLMMAVMEKQQEMMADMDFPEMEADERPNKMVGTEAPDFELPLLRTGETVKLSDLRGKVVVIDFWATWCGPCVMALPHVVEAIDAFKDRDVVFYAIDCDEPAEKVKTFVEGKNWSFPVLMDEGSKTAMKYGISGFPTTVIIGTDGKILSVQIGFLGPQNTKQKLTEEIEAALSTETQG